MFFTSSLKMFLNEKIIYDYNQVRFHFFYFFARKLNLKNRSADTAKINQIEKKNMKRKEKRKKERDEPVKNLTQQRLLQLNQKNRMSHQS